MTATDNKDFLMRSGNAWGIDVLARATRQAVTRTVRVTTKKGNLSMQKTLRSRIAAVAVAALGMGLIQSVPAIAAVSTSAPVVTGTSVVRSGSSGSAVLTFTPGTAFANSDTLKVSILTRNGQSLNTVPAGLSVAIGGTITTATGAQTTSANDLILTVTGTGTSSAGSATAATLTIDAATAPGKYTYSAVTGPAGVYTGSTAVTGTFYVSGAPATLAFDKAAYTSEASVNAAATLSITDSNGYPSYLKSGEAVQVVPASGATSSVALFDSGNYGQAAATTGYASLNLASTTAGSYSVTASGAAIVSVTSATATLTVVAAPDDATTAAPSSSMLASALTSATYYVSTAQPALTLTLTKSSYTTAGTFKLAISQTSGVPFPGGVAAKTDYVTHSADTAGTGRTASYTITSTSALAGTGYTVTVNGVTAFKIVYQAPVAYNVALTDANASTIAAVKLATTSVKFSVTDQFGAAFPGAVVNYTTSTRNTVAVKTATADSAGVVTVSTTDAASSTSTADDTLTVSVPSVSPAGAGTQTASASATIKYFSSTAIAVSTVSLAVTQPATPGTTATYDTTITSATAPSVTVDSNLADNTTDAKKLADQIKIVATVANADSTGIQGLPVTVTGSAGVYFKVGAGPSEVLLVGQTGAKTSLTGYTGASGVYTFEASFVTAGTATITVTAGGVSKTYSIKVVGSAAGIVSATASGNTVTALVTGLRGNPVAGATVTFTVASGAYIGGNFSTVNATTGTDGTAQVVVTAPKAGSYVVTTTISGGDSAVAADTTNAVAAGVASATATVTVAAPTPDPVTTAIQAQVTALSTTISAIQTAITTLVASTTATLTLIQAQINKIMKKLKI